MTNRNILEIEVNKFDFTGFVNEIAGNIQNYVEPTYACTYMRPSRIEEDVYVDLFDDELDLSEVEDTYEEDLLKNDRIMYVTFVLDVNLLCGDDGYLCGDGDTLEKYDYDEIAYGELCHENNGFIVKSKDGILTFQRATYGPANPFQYVARVVDDAGDFEEKMVEFINKYVK